jgi:hypothetical protein
MFTVCEGVSGETLPAKTIAVRDSGQNNNREINTVV